MNTWFLLANKGNAIIYNKTKEGYDIVEKFHNSIVFNRKYDVYSDRAGASKTSYTNNLLSLNSTHFDEENKRRFAKKITYYIKDAKNKDKFNKLVIIGSKSFIGYLRNKLTKPIKAKITKEILKNFYTEKEHELDLFMKQEEINYKI